MKGQVRIICLILITFIILLGITLSIEARSGCCSWHGGVCGCRCCDGTSLSAKCAPYYPSCYKKYEPVISDWDKAMNLVRSKVVEYYRNPHWFREKLIAQMVKQYNLKLDVIGWMIYTTLPDVK